MVLPKEPSAFQRLSNYSYFTRTQSTGKKVGQLTQCSTVTLADPQLYQMKVARLNIWWYCGTAEVNVAHKLDRPPVQLVMPFIVAPMASNLVSIIFDTSM